MRHEPNTFISLAHVNADTHFSRLLVVVTGSAPLLNAAKKSSRLKCAEPSARSVRQLEKRVFKVSEPQYFEKFSFSRSEESLN